MHLNIKGFEKDVEHYKADYRNHRYSVPVIDCEIGVIDRLWNWLGMGRRGPSFASATTI